MKHLSYSIEQLIELDDILIKLEQLDDDMQSRSLLVTVMSNKNESSWFASITAAIHNVFPCAVVIGASQTDNFLSKAITVLGFSFFEETRIYALARSMEHGQIEAQVEGLYQDIACIPAERTDVYLCHCCQRSTLDQVALSFEDMIEDHSLHGCLLTQGLTELSETDRVYCNGEAYDEGLIAVVFCGKQLALEMARVCSPSQLFDDVYVHQNVSPITVNEYLSLLSTSLVSLYQYRVEAAHLAQQTRESTQSAFSGLQLAVMMLEKAEKEMVNMTVQAMGVFGQKGYKSHAYA